MLIMLLFYTALALFGASLTLYGGWKTYYKEKGKPSFWAVFGIVAAIIFLIAYAVAICTIYIPPHGTS